MIRIRFLIACMLLCVLGGCGYGFSHGQSALPEDRRTLFIVEVDNPTPYSWVEPRIRSLLRDEITRRGVGEWTSREQAKGLITIEIDRYYRRSDVTGEKEETLQSVATITFEAIVRSSVDGRVMWRSGDISQEWPFAPGEGDEADQKVTELAVRRLVDRMTTGF
ncbi:LPS assembly lipoprotein LptE [Salidesulfovibrio brasiliensis]|uniref:LPS assembly lipoprotein LptE n=1 Tax=Salidesulfovibrio brasiliensis TaxID=221711 RepID=UPI0006CFBF58|nr:LPS assembly lipoprotein LptE [Salidesulfovibrio brasiliensis]